MPDTVEPLIAETRKENRLLIYGSSNHNYQRIDQENLSQGVLRTIYAASP